MTRFHALTVKEVRRETPEAVSIAFEIPETLREAYRFTPGQYLTLRAEIDGQATQRSYSICSGLDDGELRVGIKRVEGGRFSTFANDNLTEGSQLEVLPPDGRFTAALDVRAAHDYVAFAAGSGITPILSIVTSVLEREPDSRITVFYGNRATASIMFRETLEDLKDRFLERFTLVHLLSREGQDVELLHGRLDGARVAELAHAGLFDPKAADAVFLCGPGDMIEQVQTALAELGTAPDRIRTERFLPSDDGAATAAPSARAETVAAKGAEIEAVYDGLRHHFRVEAGDGNVIDAAHRQGIELPSSCKGGMCCTCRARVVEGELEMIVRVVARRVGREAPRRAVLEPLVHGQDHHFAGAAQLAVHQHAGKVGLGAGIVALVIVENFADGAGDFHTLRSSLKPASMDGVNCLSRRARSACI